jgi:LmbE family N-acetylglucosaminyl deacetylase
MSTGRTLTDERRVLVVSAHPDDIEFACGAAVACWVDEGWDVRYVIVTSGQKGVQDADADPEAFGRIREAEARAAAAICGVTDVTFLRYMDSELGWADARQLRLDLARQFRIHRPHRLLAIDPEMVPTSRFLNHPDHRATGVATLDVTMTGGTTAAIFPELLKGEGLEPWRELEEVWLYGAASSETVVDVTAGFDRKVAALRAHASQIGDWDVAAGMAKHMAAAGEPQGYGYAETFRVVSLRW